MSEYQLFATEFSIKDFSFSVISHNRGVQLLLINQELDVDFPLVYKKPASAEFFGIYQELKEYLSGKRKQFTVTLDAYGTLFQKQVWNELEKIPYGETISYGEVARRIGNPKASRAIGQANSDNPIPIIVPCHRVINADGALGGYTGGVDIKEKLLALEKKYKDK